MTNLNNKTAKRRTVTISAELNDKLKHLSDSTFTPVMRAILAVFFDGKKINYSDYNEETQVALACILPDLRRVQSQFDNGKREKNQAKSTKGVVCPVEPSQIQPNLAKPEPSIYNNIYNINNNINNKQTITNNNRQSGFDKEIYTKLETELGRLQTSSAATRGELQKELVNRFSELAYRVWLERKPLTINGTQLAPAQVLERYMHIFEPNPEQTIRKLMRIFHMFDTACTERAITNTFKYAVSLFYNQALEPAHVKETNNSAAEFSTRNYTAEEMNSLYDNLDELEI